MVLLAYARARVCVRVHSVCVGCVCVWGGGGLEADADRLASRGSGGYLRTVAFSGHPSISMIRQGSRV